MHMQCVKPRDKILATRLFHDRGQFHGLIVNILFYFFVIICVCESNW